MRKIGLLVMIVLLAAGSWLGVYPSTVHAAVYEFSAGDGTLADPYVIMTAEDLYHIRDVDPAEGLNNLDKNYILGADIDLSGFATGSGWEPIGTNSTPFTGTFDGDQYVIAGLVINRSSANNVGLFGYTSGSELHRVRLEEVDVTGGSEVGGLVGYAFNTKITYSSVTSELGKVSGFQYIGGLAGHLSNTSSIQDSYAAVNVSGSYYIGGLVAGLNLSTDTIERSYASGNVSSIHNSGGLVYSTWGPVQDSYATGNVYSDQGVAGGLVSVSRRGIHNSFYAGAVTRGDAATQQSASLVWDFGPMSSFVDTFYNTTLNPSWPVVKNVDPGTGYQGLSDSDMKTSVAYGTGLDFTTTWGITEGASYPYLRTFTPLVRIDALAQTKYRPGNVLTLEGYMSDGSQGEVVAVDYEIVNSGDAVVDSGSQNVTATGRKDPYSFPITIDAPSYPDGTYTATVKAEDASGQVSQARSVTFVVDATPPVISLIGSNPMQVTIGSTFTDPGATAHDAVDGDVTSAITVSGAVNTSVTGTYTLTYQASDAIGNSASVARAVYVVPPPSPDPITVKSNNADLTQLVLTSGETTLELSPAFKPEITEYTAETHDEQLMLRWTASDPKAVVKLLNPSTGEANSISLKAGAQAIELSVQAEDGTVKRYTVTVTRHSVSEVPTQEAECTFTDIRGHWAEEGICAAAKLGIVEGMAPNRYAPDIAVTRTEFAVMLLRTLQVPIREQAAGISFSDQSSIPQWARPEINTALAEGMLSGYPDGTFRPQHTIIRIELAAMLAKAMKWQTSGDKALSFADQASIPDWARSYAASASEQGLMQGRSGNLFVPRGITTRAEAAVVLLRLWNTLHQ